MHLRLNFQEGLLLPEYDFFSLLTDDYIQAFEADIFKRASGNKLWHRLYNYPSLGASFIYTSLGNDNVFGKAYAINPYIKFNFLSKKRFTLEYRLGIGLCYVSKHFDLTTNYQNIAVGSHMNIWFNSQLVGVYNIFNRSSIYGGTAFNHLSNANISEPNIGLNSWTFLIGADIQLANSTKKNTDSIPLINDHNQFAVIFAGGNKHTRRFAEERYFTASVSFEYKRILGHRIAIGSGADIFYDASIPDEMIREGKTEVKNLYKYKSGFHLSQELLIGRLSIGIQEGLYIFLKDELNEQKMYNRGIIRYKITDHLFMNLAMKTNLFILDVMEIGLGYYWK